MNNILDQNFYFVLFCILIGALAVFFVHWLLNRSPISSWFKSSEDLVASFMGVPAFLFGLTISTFTNGIWENHVIAKASLIKEATAISSLIRTSRALPQADQQVIVSDINNYISSILSKEWPEMRMGNAQAISSSRELDVLSSTVSRITSHSRMGNLNQDRLQTLVDTLYYERTVRLSLSSDINLFSRWPSLYFLSIMLLLTIGMLQLRKPQAMKISLTMGALCIGASMVFLFMNVSPYRGLVAVEPTMLKSLLSPETLTTK